MSKHKHTPGPWHVGAQNDSLFIINKKTPAGDYHPDLKVICPVGADREDEANARLIAAAPSNPHDCGDPSCPGFREWRKYQAAGELLEACRDAIVAIENAVVMYGHHSVLLKEHPSPCNRLDFCVMKDALRRALKIKEVIAKAEGQAE